MPSLNCKERLEESQKDHADEPAALGLDMRILKLVTAVALTLAGLNCGWSRAARPDPAALLKADRAFAQATAERRLEGFASFLEEDVTTIFCSEWCCAAHTAIGLFRTDNVSRWNPNRFVRTERRQGILLKPRRLK